MTKAQAKNEAKKAAALELIKAAGGRVTYRWTEGRFNLNTHMEGANGQRVKGLRADMCWKLHHEGALVLRRIPTGIAVPAGTPGSDHYEWSLA